MTGVIWFTQVIHYPLFHWIAPGCVPAYMRRDIPRTALVTLPGMTVEAVTGLWLVLRPPTGVDPVLAVIGFALIVILWLSRAFVQVPCFIRLTRRADEGTMTFLIRSNWLCTLVWSLRCGLVVYMLNTAMAAT